MQPSENNYAFQKTDAEQIANQLQGKRSGNGWKCKCPCHDDREASLSVTESDSVGLLFHCHAGCDGADIARSLRSLLSKDSVPPLTSKVVKLNAPQKRREPIAVYPYYNAAGVLLFEKLRYENKKFAFRYKENGEYIYKKPDVEPTVYYRPKLERLRGKVPVIICEGEKDCDNINRLFGDDYVAVTNDNGGGSWTEAHHAILYQCEIIVAEDCDEAGRKRTKTICSLAKHKLIGVLRFGIEEVGEKGDVSDWLQQGHTAHELRARIASLSPPLVEEKKKTARYDDYVRLFRSYKQKIEKDIFTNKVMFEDSDQVWKPLANKIGVLKSLAREAEHIEKKNFSASAVTDHLDHFSETLTPRLLVEIPKWDRKNNIQELCSKVKLNSQAGVTENAFVCLTKEWMANVFRKLVDPTMDTSPSREFILILTGKEKIGKDYWIRSLLCGLGQFFSPMSIGNNERDNLMQLHHSLVLNIPEFDRTSKFETSFIKDIVTRSSTNIRGSYARDEEIRFSRTNFIASANMSDLLRDHGQNTRYAIFELDGIERSYAKTKEFSLQCLAEAQHLANCGYVAPAECWDEMKNFIEEMTPEDPNAEIGEIYEGCVNKWLDTLKMSYWEVYQEIEKNGYATSNQLNEVFADVAKKTGGSLRRIKMALVAQRYRFRTEKTRLYWLKRPPF